MIRYMLILFQNEDVYANFSPEYPLEPPAKTVKGKDKIEPKELASGYYLIKTDSLEEVNKLVKGVPCFIWAALQKCTKLWRYNQAVSRLLINQYLRLMDKRVAQFLIFT